MPGPVTRQLPAGEILPGQGWERLISLLCEEQGTVMLLGATDSGKTTLARYIVESLVRRRLRTALIDSDIGQSSLGLPGTISMKVFLDENDLGDFVFARMTFLGFTNPAKVIPLTVKRTKRMAGIGRRRAEAAVIDTSGLISGEPGRALKLAKIKAIRPEYIAALQRGDELEHILSSIRDARILRMNVSPASRRRSTSARSAYRKKKLREYFGAGDLYRNFLDATAVRFSDRGLEFRLGEKEVSHGTIVGLNRDDGTVALGIIDAVEEKGALVWSPLRSLRGIHRAVCGDMTMT